MTQRLSIQPAEKGTAIVTIAPVDENGVALTIGQLTNPAWQLMKRDGTVINGKAFAACQLTALSWVLSGDDLEILNSSDIGFRVLSFKATYDSTAGSNLPLNDECSFSIKKLLGQVDAG